MGIFKVAATAALAFTGFAFAAPSQGLDKRYTTTHDNGVTYNVFEHAATGAKLEFVTNSGICETTAGVNQYSGYLSVGTNENMWFWFFEARNSPTTAPLATWFNGGPGCSSMIGLFQENGPCHFVNGASTPSLNPYSWNTNANMLYIDQPIGVGFSYGTNPVTSTVTAAPLVWKFLQAFYAQFPTYENRSLGIFTESYGGHYGPEFASYIQDQNAAIDAGTVSGEKFDIVALGINNGWIDAALQEEQYVEYAYKNSYKKLITAAQYTSYKNAYTSSCAPAIAKCTGITGTNAACVAADTACYNAVEGPVSEASDFDVYDVREPSNDPYPPETYATYLTKAAVVSAIGAKSTYQECPTAPYTKFANTGDNPRSFLSVLSKVVQSGIRVLVWAGDADWICNYMGVKVVAEAVTYSGTATFKAKALSAYTVNGNHSADFKTVDNFSYMQVFEAGHEVPYYQPQTALQVFNQIMAGGALTST